MVISMDKNYMNLIQKSLDNIGNYFNKNMKNSIEKINIITKIEELVFWLEQYKEQYLESDGNK